jgi:hypothetical protein
MTSTKRAKPTRSRKPVGGVAAARAASPNKLETTVAAMTSGYAGEHAKAYTRGTKAKPDLAVKHRMPNRQWALARVAEAAFAMVSPATRRKLEEKLLAAAREDGRTEGGKAAKHDCRDRSQEGGGNAILDRGLATILAVVPVVGSAAFLAMGCTAIA